MAFSLFVGLYLAPCRVERRGMWRLTEDAQVQGIRLYSSRQAHILSNEA